MTTATVEQRQVARVALRAPAAGQLVEWGQVAPGMVVEKFQELGTFQDADGPVELNAPVGGTLGRMVAPGATVAAGAVLAYIAPTQPAQRPSAPRQTAPSAAPRPAPHPSTPQPRPASAPKAAPERTQSGAESHPNLLPKPAQNPPEITPTPATIQYSNGGNGRRGHVAPVVLEEIEAPTRQACNGKA